MASVYVLLSSKDKKTYTGSTVDLSTRLVEHDEGRVISTRNRRPLKLVYKEDFVDLHEARLRERYLKTRAGRRELKTILSKVL